MQKTIKGGAYLSIDMGPKQKTAPKKKLTPEQTQKIESTISVFQQQWGMNLNAKDTQKVIERVAEHITEQDSEVKVRPAVRNQMFAMLIKKAPEKAMAFRINMKEKRGANYSAEQKQHILSVAQNQGWRAARAELASIGKKPKKKAVVQKKPALRVADTTKRKAPARRASSRVKKTPKKTAIAPKASQSAEKTGGKTMEQIIKNAEQANKNIIATWETYQEEKEAINKKYEDKLAGGISSGSVKNQSEKVDARMQSNPEYQREIMALEKETVAKLKIQKNKRDAILRTALEGMGYKGTQLTSVHNKLTNARAGLGPGEYRAVGNPNFKPSDLTRGVRENYSYFSTAMNQLKVLAKAKRI